MSFESFAYSKLGYRDEYELGPGEIARITPDGVETLSPAGDKMRICAFLWTYYGYPNSNYEGVNVEVMRYRNGHIMARDEAARGRLPEVDYVAGVPDSGVPHAIGYANECGIPFARPFIKYTPTWPRSFMPSNQEVRNRVAKMKQVPVPELIDGKKLLFVDDSIVRGTQLRETVDFLYESGASEVHMRSACPPIMFGCKYLSFSSSKSDMELLARRVVQRARGRRRAAAPGRIRRRHHRARRMPAEVDLRGDGLRFAQLPVDRRPARGNRPRPRARCAPTAGRARNRASLRGDRPDGYRRAPHPQAPSARGAGPFSVGRERPGAARGRHAGAAYSSTGFHSLWSQIHAWGSSTEKNTSVGSLGPS